MAQPTHAPGGLGLSPAPASRLASLRAELARRGLAGFIVPRSDEHQNEYVAPYGQRLAWLTGFTGSAGTCVVTADKAALFVDGRYTLQARDEVDVRAFEQRHLVLQPLTQWVEQGGIGAGGMLGYDPWLHTPNDVAELKSACEKAGVVLTPCETNAVDSVWSDRPARPLAAVAVHDASLAGRSSPEKRAELGKDLVAKGLAAAFLSGPDSIAWLLNVRGADLPHTPFALGFALLAADGKVELFMEGAKVPAATRSHLGPDVTVREPTELGAALDRLGQRKARVLVDPATAPSWAADRLSQAGAAVVRDQDPCALPKACKNAVELEGARNAHRRDAAAMVRLLAWLAETAPAGQLTELDVAARLEAERKKDALFRDLSFDSIAGAGANGAIIHYRPTETSNRRLERDSIFLLDSGGQYPDGTTDITRTVAIGTPTAEQRERFTRVLIGHIRLATARFPVGTTGPQLDTLARYALWQAGLDYDHGTGHGVGSYLSVHEGPHRIAKVQNRVALRPGMIVSNEPGYYKTGAYGIRIENLIAVTSLGKPAGGELELLGFETLTLVPIDRALVDTTLLAPAEREWLDAYHARVWAEVSPLVDGVAKQWLERVTKPL